MQFTPNVVAGATIRPFRFVTISGDAEVEESDALEIPVGVTTGSTVDFTSDNHATVGLEVSLQTGLIVRVQAGGSVSAGDWVQSNADGEAITAGTMDEGCIAGIALHGASDLEELLIYFNPHHATIAA